MTVQLPPTPPSLEIHRDRLHRFKTLDGRQFFGVVREFIEGPGAAVFVVDGLIDAAVPGKVAPMRWVSVAGLMWWEVVDTAAEGEWRPEQEGPR